MDSRPRQEDSRVRFGGPRAENIFRSQENRDSSYNRGRDNGYSRSREQSPSSNRGSYSRGDGRSHSRGNEQRYQNNSFREPHQPNNYNHRFINRRFHSRQDYGDQIKNYNNAPRAWPNEGTDQGINQWLGQRDIVCYNCNKRRHIYLQESVGQTLDARINNPFRLN